MRIRNRIVALLCLSLLALAGCGVLEARKLASAEAIRFHELLNSAQYADLFNGASAEFRKGITEEQWVAFCGEIRKRCGKWKSSEPKNKDEEFPVLLVDSGGYIVILTYSSQFELGVVDELLRVAVKDGKASLLSYHVDSPLFRQPAPDHSRRGQDLTSSAAQRRF